MRFMSQRSSRAGLDASAAAKPVNETALRHRLSSARAYGAALALALVAGCSSGGDTEASVAVEAGADCDRACVQDVANKYLAALSAGDSTAAPLAPNFKLVENLETMTPDQGLWSNISKGVGEFSLLVPDPVLQTAGWLGTLEQGGKPILAAIRLKIEGKQIVEAEHLVTTARPENLVRLQVPRPGIMAEIPADKRLDHDALINLGLSYYDALDDNDGTLTPFAADCLRHENGMITAGAGAGAGPNNAGTAPIARDCEGQLTSKVMSYIDSIDNRRVFAADPVTGLVMGLSHFRHSMDFEPYEVTALDGSKILYGKDRFPFEPFDLPAAHIYKIGADGKMHEIEAMGYQTKYKSEFNN